jgi:transcriptional regulator with XRE-family HTH domain
MGTVGERLQKAIDDWDGGGKFAFYKAISETGVRGRSRPSIDSYLSGKVKTPRLEFLEAAAKILGVSLEWLRTGQDWRDPEAEEFFGDADLDDELEALFPADAEGTRRRKLREMSLLLGSMAQANPALWDLPYPSLLLLTEGAGYEHLRLAGERADYPAADPDAEARALKVGALLGRCLAAPLEILGVDPSELSSHNLERYLTSMGHALSMVSPKPRVEEREEVKDEEA